MGHELPGVVALAKWFQGVRVHLAAKHNCASLPWEQFTESERGLEIAVVSKFIEEYGPVLAVSRKVWDAAGYVWADWSIGKIDPAVMEGLRQALIEYGEALSDQRPLDPIMRPYEQAAQLVRGAGGDKAHMETLALTILDLGKRDAEKQRAGLRSR